ncbi:MAG: site-specific integrase [Planctomycetes bacterium]|nr:site-specific integrase [Planctomycetota bacterium]
MSAEAKVSRVPSYRRHKATGQAVVTLSGRDLYLGRYNSKHSRAEYNRLVGEWIANGCEMPQEADNITIVEMLAKWWIHAKQHYRRNGKPTSSLQSFRQLLKPLRETYGHTPAAAFGPLALKAFRDQFVAQGRSRNYVNRSVGRIKQVFKWAVAEELVQPSVYQALACVGALQRGRTTARETEGVLPVAASVVDATLPHLPTVVADMVRFQRLTGARPTEVCTIRPADVDRNGPVWRYVPQEHKTEHHNRQRVIFIGPKAQAILSPYLLRHEDEFCFCPCDSERTRRADRHEARQTPMSCGNKPGSNRKRNPKRGAGSHYTKDSYNRAVCRACELAFEMPVELRKKSKNETNEGRQARDKAARKWRREYTWCPSQLRHSAATEIRRLYGLEAAQVTLGHSKADVTQIYAERDFDKAAEVMAKIG